MNKKIFIIIGAVIIALIFLVLIVLVMVDNKNPSKEVSFSMNSNRTQANTIEPTQQPTTTEEPTIDEDGREKIEGEILEVETEDGGIIPVPPTFTYAGGESNYGAVIEDKDGNEFVWVPVNDFNSYQRQLFANNGPRDNNSNSNEEQVTLKSLKLKDINSYNLDFDDSVRNYHGFYIARFEAGKERKNGKNYAVSKSNIVPWTQVTWQQAKDASQDMYVKNDYFETDLINSYAWDTTCNWLRETGVNVDNSVDYGNYQNSPNGLNRVVETASNNRWQVNNIYDMAGNAWEYTTEESGEHDTYHVGRGGAYANEGDWYPISSRAVSGDTPNLAVAFRVVMYLK